MRRSIGGCVSSQRFNQRRADAAAVCRTTGAALAGSTVAGGSRRGRHLLQGSAQATRVAGELHGGCVGERLAAAGQPSLEQQSDGHGDAPEECGNQPADEGDPQANPLSWSPRALASSCEATEDWVIAQAIAARMSTSPAVITPTRITLESRLRMWATSWATTPCSSRRSAITEEPGGHDDGAVAPAVRHGIGVEREGRRRRRSSVSGCRPRSPSRRRHCVAERARAPWRGARRRPSASPASGPRRVPTDSCRGQRRGGDVAHDVLVAGPRVVWVVARAIRKDHVERPDGDPPEQARTSRRSAAAADPLPALRVEEADGPLRRGASRATGGSGGSCDGPDRCRRRRCGEVRHHDARPSLGHDVSWAPHRACRSISFLGKDRTGRHHGDTHRSMRRRRECWTGRRRSVRRRWRCTVLRAWPARPGATVSAVRD